ncbi:MAG: class I tRNA ligase family protein, partial [Oscillospiraceae bacterium]
KGGYLVKVEPHTHNVGACYRCHNTVEPRVSKQWFVKMETLAKPAIDAVKDGKTKFVPERFDKVYFHWLENIRDWCISRQLWWGHRIPAYYCADCGEIIVSKEKPTTCVKCGSTNLKQDEDTLDTWFSSALWPFSTLGWPNNTEDLKYFYPTNTLVTGYDIIFFWVVRMVFSALEQTNQVPFDTVLIHGLIRDEQGRKMSKSLGNGIDPLEVIEEYGADALRLTLVTGNSPGNDMRFSKEKVKSSRNFANKLWNATRFIMMNLDEDIKEIKLPQNLNIEDKWVLSQYNSLVKEVSDNIEKFELGLAVSKLYDFIWDIFCDWYIELTKTRLAKGTQSSTDTQQILLYIISNSIILLHPFMPFITEEIWQSLPTNTESIMSASFPVYNEELHFKQEENDFTKIMEAIRGIRNIRTEMNVPPSKKA